MSTQIKNAAHAVRVLEYLVEEMERLEKTGGPKNVKLSLDGDVEGMRYIGTRYLMAPALVEGAKAVLKRHASFQNTTAQSYRSVVDKRNQENDAWEARYGAGAIVIALAKAYAPRMAEAGMEMPV